MVAILAQGRHGAAYQLDDGSVVHLPPEAQLPWAQPEPPAPVQPAASQPPPIGEAPPVAIAPPGPNPVDAASPPGDVSGAPSIPGPSASPAPVASPPVAGAGAPPQDAAAAPAPSAAPPPDPFQQQADAALAGGALAADAASAKAAAFDAAQKAAAPLEAQRQEAQARILARQAELNDLWAKSVDEQSKYDVRAPKSSTASTAGKLIALALGGIGQALSRVNGPNPVLEVLERKAQQEANERMARYSQLGANVGAAKGKLDEIGRLSTSTDARYHGQIAAVWDNYGKEAERQAVMQGGQQALVAGQTLAAQAYQKRDEATAKAAEAHQKAETDQAKLTLDQYKTVADVGVAQQNAQTSRINAGTSAGQLALDRTKEHRLADKDVRDFAAGEGDKTFDRSVKLQDLILKAQGQRSASVTEARAARDEQRTVDKLAVFNPLTGKALGKGAPDDVTARALRDSLGATASVARTIDLINRLADRAGGSSEILKSGEWQEITANREMIRQQIRMGLKMGTLDKGAADSMDRILGGVDPTSFIRDAAPGLRAARNGMIQAANDSLRAAGIGDQLDIPEMSNAGLQKRADLGEAGEMVKSINAADAAASKDWTRSIPGGVAAALGESPQGHALKVTPLILLARSDDPRKADSAKAGLASLALKNPAIARHVIAAGVDLSSVPELTPEQWKAIQAAGAAAP